MAVPSPEPEAPVPPASAERRAALRQAQEREAAARSRARRIRDLTERGEFFLRQPASQANCETALERYEAALALDPPLALPYVGAARALLILASAWYRAPAPAAARAQQLLERALAIEPRYALAHTHLGAMLAMYALDWPAAEAAFQRALELAPDLALVHTAYAIQLTRRGRFAEAEQCFDRSHELDPLNLTTRLQRLTMLTLQRRIDDARAELDALADMAPDNPATLTQRGFLALTLGDYDEAVRYYRKRWDREPQHTHAAGTYAIALAANGHQAEADRLMGELKATRGELVSPYLQALWHSFSGRSDAAIGQLEEAIRLRDPYANLLPVDLQLEVLHSHPQWPALRQRVLGLGG